MKTNLLKSIFISLILLVGATSAWGNVVSQPKIYYNNTNTSYTNIAFMVGHNSYSRAYKLTKIADTNLWYRHLKNTGNDYWSDATQIAIFGVNWDTSEGSSIANRSSYTGGNYTSTRTLNANTGSCNSLDADNTYYVTADGNKKTTYIYYKSAGYNGIQKYNATQSAKVRNTTSGAYSEASGNWPATLKLTGTYLSGDGASGRSEISSTKSSDGNDKKVYGAVVTGLITHSYASLSNDYQFDGWIKGDGTSFTSTNPTYSYNITANTTVYACFTKKHAITFGVHSSGGGSITATAGGNSITSETKVVGGSQIIFTATPSAGYQIEGWYSNSACTTPIDNGTHDTYTVTITDGTNVYVKYEEIPEDKFAVEISTDGNGTVDLSASEQIGKSGKSITATPNEGFDFDHWKVDGGATVADEKAANTTITATDKGSVTAYFKEIMRTISVTCNDARYGTVSPTSTKAGIATPSENITATPAEGYELKGWSVTSGSNNITLSSTTATTIQVTQAKVDGSISATFQEKKYNITVLKDGKTSTTQQIGATTQVSITAATLTGFEFVGWVVSSEQTPGCITIDDPTKQTAKVTATGTGTITATYKETGVLYFKNNLGWSNVYVYFHTSNSYWDATLGSGSYGLTIANGRAFKMERIGNTDIYKCHYGAKGTVPTNSLAFTPDNKENNGNFYRTKASYRTDFNSQMELFIPQNTKTETKNETDYYNNGVWMKYNSTESGYSWSSDQNSWNTTTNPLVAKVAGGYSFSTTIKLTQGTTYKFKISNSNNVWFGNTGTMTEDNCTGWTFESREWREDEDNGNAKITPTVTGDYIFTLYLGDGKVSISLEYPLATNDYRLAYIEGDDKSTLHPNHHFKRRTTGAEILDTLSFFVRRDKSPKILLQHCSGFDNNQNPTWVTDVTYSVSLDSTAVYNFVFKQTNSGNGHTRELDQTKTHLYSGDYYIRTDAAEGGWQSYRQASNRMNYSTYADLHSEFNHYFCSYREKGCNVKFIVANDYSECLTETMDNDDIIRPNQSSVGCLPENANVRFGWNSKTNELTRAYISGAGLVEDRFLVLMGNEYLKDAEGKALVAGTNGSPRYGLKANEEIFKDMGNWIYQVDVQACNQTTIRLSALYNGQEQLFKGARNDISLLNSTEPKYYKVRMIYDFKTNHMISAWLLDEQGNTIEGEGSLASDILVIRKNQDQANQLTFRGDAERTDVGVVYGVMTFDKFFLNNIDNEGNPLDEEDNKFKTIYERALYWISFPFNVKLKDIFGFSNYGDHWILEKYNGEARAENGAWVDSESYWEYITDSEYELEAGKGYVLCLDLDKMGVNSDVFQHTDEVSLYFPSKEKLGTINGATTSITLDPYTCTIERDNRNIYDSNWHLIGVPRFADITTKNINIIPQPTQENVGFYYEYGRNGEYTVKKSGATTFQTMSAYLVQYAGVINWTSTGITVPAAIAARKNSSAEPEQVHLRLEIAQDDEMADQTFVQLQQEGATAEFDMNLDLTKMLHSGTNIYTLAGEQGIKSAGNVMPMSECVVPVGVKVDTEGEYTFRMPDGTEGMVVELIDYYTNTRTNLLLFDYTVDLSAGTCNDRFALHIQPSKSGVTTGIDQINGGSMHHEGVQKYLIDGQLYIVREGVVYDAQGKRL